MACFDHSVDDHELKEVTYMEAVCGCIKADVEYYFFVFEFSFDFFGVSHLGNKAATLEIFINSHFRVPPFYNKLNFLQNKTLRRQNRQRAN